MEYISELIVPLIMVMVGVGLVFSKKDMFSEFTCGAKEGIQTAVKLLPTLVALLAAIGMFNASGASAALADWVSPIAQSIGIPSEIVPLILVRPMSGSASTALIADIYTKYGADSLVGRCTSVIAGSSDTIFYIVSVYFGAVGVKKTRGSVPISFVVAVFAVFFGTFLCRIYFKIR